MSPYKKEFIDKKIVYKSFFFQKIEYVGIDIKNSPLTGNFDGMMKFIIVLEWLLFYQDVGCQCFKNRMLHSK